MALGRNELIHSKTIRRENNHTNEIHLVIIFGSFHEFNRFAVVIATNDLYDVTVLQLSYVDWDNSSLMSGASGKGCSSGYGNTRPKNSPAGLGVLQFPHGLNCRPVPCEGVAGAMSVSRVVCKVVQFTVKQRQLHASPPANELSWLLEPKFLATPEIGSSQSGVEVNLSRQRRFEV